MTDPRLIFSGPSNTPTEPSFGGIFDVPTAAPMEKPRGEALARCVDCEDEIWNPRNYLKATGLWACDDCMQDNPHDDGKECEDCGYEVCECKVEVGFVTYFDDVVPSMDRAVEIDEATMKGVRALECGGPPGFQFTDGASTGSTRPTD